MLGSTWWGLDEVTYAKQALRQPPGAGHPGTASDVPACLLVAVDGLHVVPALSLQNSPLDCLLGPGRPQLLLEGGPDLAEVWLRCAEDGALHIQCSTLLLRSS